VCAGEVDDVLALIDVTFAQPYADPARTAMFGVSHGGCITLRAVARGAPVAAAVDIEGPTDWASNYAFWQRGLADPAASTFTKSSYQQLIAALDAAVGGPPERFPAAYALRSPQSEAAQIAAFGGALLILHGAADVLVPPSQSCDLALQTGHYLASHTGAPSPFGLPNALVPTAPGECPEPALAWATASKPQALSPPWPGTRFLTIYDGIGHGAGGDMVPDVLSFFAAKGVAP